MNKFTWVVLCALLLVGMLPGENATAAEQPNFFIFSDDVNRDSWGVYGNPDCRTPNIDRIAAEGIRFDNMYCTVAMCAPFRQELYSGCTPWRTGTLANHSKSVAGTKSLPHYLEPLGYRVALLGKTHIGPRECYPFQNLSGQENEAFVASTEKFLKKCKQEEKPFCLFIASHDGHAPHNSGDASQYPPEKLTVAPYWLDTPELRENLSRYYAEVTHFDELVGRTRKLLEETGLLDNTLIVVCSEQGVQFPFAKWTCFDNGLHIGMVARWPKRIKAGSVAPQLLSLGDVAPTFVELADGSLKSPACDGQSFVRVLDGKPDEIHQYVYGAFTNCRIIDNRERIYPIRAIRDRRYTLLYCPNSEDITSNVTLSGALAMLNGQAPQRNKGDIAVSWARQRESNPRADFLVQRLFHRPQYALFDRTTDPYEEHDLADDPAHRETLERMKSALAARLQELGDTDPIATEKEIAGAKSAKK